jgi:hypothetical protein
MRVRHPDACIMGVRTLYYLLATLLRGESGWHVPLCMLSPCVFWSGME